VLKLQNKSQFVFIKIKFLCKHLCKITKTRKITTVSKNHDIHGNCRKSWFARLHEFLFCL